MAKVVPIRGKDGQFRGSIGAGKAAAPVTKPAVPKKPKNKAAAAKPKRKTVSKSKRADKTEDLVEEGITGDTPLARAIQRIQQAPFRAEIKDAKEDNLEMSLLSLPGNPYKALIVERKEIAGGPVEAYIFSTERADKQDTLATFNAPNRTEALSWSYQQILPRASERTIFNGRYQTDPRNARQARRELIADLGPFFVRDGAVSAQEADLMVSFEDRTAFILGTKEEGFRVQVRHTDEAGEDFLIHDLVFKDSRRAVDFAEEMVLITR